MIRRVPRLLECACVCAALMSLSHNSAAIGGALDTETTGPPAVAPEASPAQNGDNAVKDEGTEPIAPPSAQGERIVGAYVSAAGEVEMGSGTFIVNRSNRNAYVAWNGVVLPGYQFADRTRIQLSVGFSQELTQSDGDSVPRQFLLSDPRLSISRPLYRWDSTQTQISGAIGVSAPVSLRSRFEGLYTSADLRLQLQQPVGDFFFAFSTSFRKNFHRYTTPVLSSSDAVDDRGLRTALARDSDKQLTDAGIAIGMQNNVSFRWSNSLLAAYSFTDKLSAAVSYTLAHGWSYESFPQDDLTAAGAQSGNRRGDSSAADLSVSYQALENLGIDAGVRTLTTPRTADDKALRFPFYEFNNAQLNLSVFYISAILTERIPL